MQSFLIIGKDKEKISKYYKDLAAEEKISKFDIFLLTPEKSVGIADIRNISRNIFLKPISGGKKIVVLEAYLGMTVDSQNAFLKILEEPPLSTIIVILATENFFLPTILSRVKLIELDKNVMFEANQEKEIEETLESLKNDESFDRLKLAQDISKDKQTALEFLEKLITVARIKMINDAGSRGEYKKIIETLNIYYNEIKRSNVNLRLGLENLFLEI